MIRSTILISIAGVVACQQKLTMHELQVKVAQIAEQSRTHEDSTAALGQLPKNELLLAVSDALTRRIYQDAKLRGLSYRILSDNAGVESENGYRALLSCLDDLPVFLGLCAGALTKAPAEKLPEVADALESLLSAKERSLVDKEIALKMLAEIGPAANKHLADIDRIFHDIQAPDRLRWFAARGVLLIGGTEHALKVFANVDPIGLKVAFWELESFAGETKGKFGTDNKETRKRMREFVRKGLSHPDVEFRAQALRTFLYTFGEDTIVVSRTEEFILDPELRDALESVIHTDTDQKLRQAARFFLNEFEKDLVEKNRQ